MKVRTILVITGVAVVCLAVVLFLFSSVTQQQEKTRKASKLVEEGFLVLENNPDEAIRFGLEARELKPDDIGAVILLGRAQFSKKRFRQSIAVLQEGLNTLEDMDYFQELSYHIGLAYTELYRETKIAEDWEKAFKNLSDATELGCHRADANYALGLLHCLGDYFDSDKVVLYWERAMPIEDKLESYPGSGQDGACPYCHLEFKRKKDQFLEHYKRLSQE